MKEWRSIVFREVVEKIRANKYRLQENIVTDDGSQKEVKATGVRDVENMIYQTGAKVHELG